MEKERKSSHNGIERMKHSILNNQAVLGKEIDFKCDDK